MPDRLSRLAPLTGVLFAGLTVASFVLSNNSPDPKSSGRRVIHFYEAHQSSQRASDLLLALAVVFLLFFAGSLRGYLRRTPAAEPLSAVVLAAGVLLAAGLALFAGMDFALADVPSHLDPAAAQAMNVLNSDLFIPTSTGGCAFGIASGLAILRGARLPKWLGWVAILIGIITVTPAAIVGLLGFIVWTVVVSLLIWRRGGADKLGQAPATPDPAAT
ncbi:MAG: hypothetical protein QOK04_2750 [Solirubrobacteraceae bacterium]|jgi:hypothetical protein|nr:hypothetical protein [Solirubrobacteraceae bacterium]